MKHYTSVLLPGFFTPARETTGERQAGQPTRYRISTVESLSDRLVTGTGSGTGSGETSRGNTNLSLPFVFSIGRRLNIQLRQMPVRYSARSRRPMQFSSWQPRSSIDQVIAAVPQSVDLTRW